MLSNIIATMPHRGSVTMMIQGTSDNGTAYHVWMYIAHKDESGQGRKYMDQDSPLYRTGNNGKVCALFCVPNVQATTEQLLAHGREVLRQLDANIKAYGL